MIYIAQKQIAFNDLSYSVGLELIREIDVYRTLQSNLSALCVDKYKLNKDRLKSFLKEGATVLISHINDSSEVLRIMGGFNTHLTAVDYEVEEDCVYILQEDNSETYLLKNGLIYVKHIYSPLSPVRRQMLLKDFDGFLVDEDVKISMHQMTTDQTIDFILVPHHSLPDWDKMVTLKDDIAAKDINVWLTKQNNQLLKYRFINSDVYVPIEKEDKFVHLCAKDKYTLSCPIIFPETPGHVEKLLAECYMLLLSTKREKAMIRIAYCSKGYRSLGEISIEALYEKEYKTEDGLLTKVKRLLLSEKINNHVKAVVEKYPLHGVYEKGFSVILYIDKADPNSVVKNTAVAKEILNN
jgi:hypothetical protein